jgi:hypothetical protein
MEEENEVTGTEVEVETSEVTGTDVVEEGSAVDCDCAEEATEVE